MKVRHRRRLARRPGWLQTEPFILCPATMFLADHPLVGASIVCRQLMAWRAELQREQVS